MFPHTKLPIENKIWKKTFQRVSAPRESFKLSVHAYCHLWDYDVCCNAFVVAVFHELTLPTFYYISITLVFKVNCLALENFSKKLSCITTFIEDESQQQHDGAVIYLAVVLFAK